MFAVGGGGVAGVWGPVPPFPDVFFGVPLGGGAALAAVAGDEGAAFFWGVQGAGDVFFGFGDVVVEEELVVFFGVDEGRGHGFFGGLEG